MDAVFQLPASLYHEETFFAAKSGFLLEGQQMLYASILHARNFHHFILVAVGM